MEGFLVESPHAPIVRTRWEAKRIFPPYDKKSYTVVCYRKHYLGGQKANSLSGVRDCFSVLKRDTYSLLFIHNFLSPK